MFNFSSNFILFSLIFFVAYVVKLHTSPYLGLSSRSHLMQCLGMLPGCCYGPEMLWEVASARSSLNHMEIYSENDNTGDQS